MGYDSKVKMSETKIKLPSFENNISKHDKVIFGVG